VGLEPGRDVTPADRNALADRNRRLAPYKRVSAFLVWREDFPRTASLKIKRHILAEQLRARTNPGTDLVPL
jgi:hypothetical protein